MSAKAGSIGSIILGVVLTAVGIWGGVPYWGLTVLSGTFMIAGGALGLAYSPKADSQGMAAQQDVKFSTAATGMPVPVVFGTARVTPNFIRCNQGLLEAEEIEGSSGGKGGGSASQVVGYNYFWTWEAALCMGSLESVGQVYGMPGEVPMIDAVDPWVNFDPDDYVELTLQVADQSEDEQNDSPEGGVVRLYRGTQDQTRETTGDVYAATGLNYRGTAFAVFGISSGGQRYSLGMTNFVKTYQFMVRRPCECVYDDGSPVVGMKLRGSDDTGNPAYHLANPAAIYWEVLTNKDWGRGLSSDIVNAASFISVSEYYATNNIGLGLILESPQDIGSFLEGIQRHCRTLLTWDGEVYKLSTLLDINETHGTILTLRDSDLIDLQLGVPLWDSVKNEVRAEFTSPERGERPDTISQQDIAVVDILGGRVVSQRVQLPGFNSWNLAYQQVARILAEMSYPWRTAQWEMNRFKSHLAVGQVVRIIWTEFTTEVVTSYWLIVQITDGASDDEKIMVRAVEDQLLAPVEGEELYPDIPDKYPWQRIVPVDPDDVYLEDTADEPGVGFAVAYELPAIMTATTNQALVVFGMEQIASYQAAAAVWRSYDDVTYESVTQYGAVVAAMELVDAMPGDQFWDRSAAGTRVDMNLTFDGAFPAANEIQLDTEHLSDLIDIGRHWLICEEELMQVGLVELVSGVRYRLRNVIRGRFGTRPVSHPVGAKVFYARTLNLDTAQSLSNEGEVHYFRMQAWRMQFTVKSYFGDVQACQFFHYGSNDTKLLRVGLKPLPPEPVSIVDGGTDVTLVVRPRFVRSGAGVDPFNVAGLTPVASLGSMTFAVKQLDATDTDLTENPVPVSNTYVPATLVEPGSVTITVDKLAGATGFKVYSVTGTHTSIESAYLTL